MIRKADQRSADTRGVFLIITVVGLKTFIGKEFMMRTY
jgi:hypothetical protein